MLIFLVGVRGAGKTSCIEHLRTRADLNILQPSTTRQPRTAPDTEYDFRSAFDVPMAWEIQVGHHLYGMRQSEVDQIRASDVGITVFEPGNMDRLLRFREASNHEVVIVGLDTISTAAEQLTRVGGDARRAQQQHEIDAQRVIIEEHADLLVTGALAENIAAIESTIRLLRNRGGIVDHQTMLDLLRAGTLLKPYQEDRTQRASYDLRLGDQLLFDGGVVSLTAQRPTFSIPPYSFIIAESLEKADLPKFLSGRFDLRVSHFMKGIILSNGPQVDPGFRGALFCMLYNASDRPVPIKQGEHFATIEFHTTALSTTGSRPTEYHYFQNLQRLSADILERPGSKLLSRIEAVKPGVSKVLSVWTATFAIFAAGLGVLVAWALTTLIDVQKLGADLKRQLEDSKEIVEKLQVERGNLQAEGQKSLTEIKRRAEEAEGILKLLQGEKDQRSGR